MKTKKIKKEKAITLVALIITIIVLLILAMVSISLVMNGGIIDRTNNGVTKYSDEEVLEQIKLAYSEWQMVKYSGQTSDDAQTFMTDKLEEVLGLEDGKVTVTESSGTYKVVIAGGKTYTYNPSTGETGVTGTSSSSSTEAVVIPEGLEVGSVVYYCPSGTYTWNQEYAQSNTSVTGTITLDSSTDAFKTEYWHVLSIDQTTGQVELVPAYSYYQDGNGNADTRVVTLEGAQGYNNGVKLLNEACSTLYSDSSKGITARSINIEDIEKYMTDGAKSNVDNINNYTGTQASSAYETLSSYYPSIYADEYKSVINGTENTSSTALRKSDSQSQFITRANEKKQATTSGIQPYGTGYSGDLRNSSNITAPYNTILGNWNYWVASRIISAGDTGCTFDVNSVSDRGGLGGRRVLVLFENIRTEWRRK